MFIIANTQQKNLYFYFFLKKQQLCGVWLARLVEHPNLDLGVVSLSPTLGKEIT